MFSKGTLLAYKVKYIQIGGLMFFKNSRIRFFKLVGLSGKNQKGETQSSAKFSVWSFNIT